MGVSVVSYFSDCDYIIIYGTVLYSTRVQYCTASYCKAFHHKHAQHAAYSTAYSAAACVFSF